MPPTWVKLPARNGPPLVALSDTVLVAGCDALLRSHAVAPETGALRALSEFRVPSRGGRFVSIALSPDGNVLAALLANAKGNHPPALLVLEPGDMSLTARVELRHLPATDSFVPLAVVTMRSGSAAVVLPSVVLQLSASRKYVQKRVVLEVPSGVPPALPSSPCAGHIPGLVCADYEAVDAVSIGTVGMLDGCGRADTGVVVRYATGEVSVYDVASYSGAANLEPSAAGGKHAEHAAVSPMLSYTGDRYEVLAVAGLGQKVADVRDTSDVFAVALIQDRGDDAVRYDGTMLFSEDFVESTLAPRPCPQWGLISGNGEDSCFPIEVVPGLADSLTSEDFPLSCTTNADSTISIVSCRGRVLIIDVNQSPSLVASCCYIGSGGSKTGASPIVAPSVTLRCRWNLAVMFPASERGSNPFQSDSFCVQLLESHSDKSSIAGHTLSGDSAETIPPPPMFEKPD